jgi:hypothetical protein
LTTTIGKRSPGFTSTDRGNTCLFDNKQEERVRIATLEDIYEYAERLQQTVRTYITADAGGSPGKRSIAAASPGTG